jgi:polyhydroxyalkanoate synthesis regulator phasin
VPDLERKVDQLEEELNFLSSKRDLNKLESFINEISGKVLHPQHYLMLIARRNYKYICHKQLISELTRCASKAREEVKEKFKFKMEEMDSLGWISKLLLGEE